MFEGELIPYININFSGGLNIKRMLLLILLVGLLAISSVSASDVANETNNLVSTNTIENQIDYNENLQLQSSEDVKTFDDLRNEINGLSDNGTLELYNDYKYNGSYYDGYSSITINQNNVTINGNGHTLNANGGGNIFKITGNNVVLKNLIFTKAHATYWGGNAVVAYQNSGLTVINSSFMDNYIGEGSGAAIYVNNCDDVTVINSSFINNVASLGGGGFGGGAIYARNSNVSVFNSSFINNTMSDDFGGGAISSVNLVDGCIFINNYAQWFFGGAVYDVDVVNNCVFINNSADNMAGAVYGADVVSNSVFVNNSAGSGGAIGGSKVIVNSTFVNNSASRGGAIYCAYKWKGDCPVVVVNSSFVNNSADYGGAISSYSVSNYANLIDVINSSFANNSAKNGGGAIYNKNNFSIMNSTFINNMAYNNEVVNSSVLKANNLANSMTYGGAVYNDGNLTVSKSSFIQNMADVGGAIYNAGNNSVVEVSEFVNNSAVDGGAISNVADNVSVLSSEFVNNTAKENGGAIMNNGTDFVAKNNTFKGNNATNGSDIYGDVYSVYLDSKDISMFFKDGTRFVAVLRDSQGNLLSNQTLIFTINGQSYDRSTDENGSASIALNLVSGTYNANVYFNGTSKYNSASKNVTIDIKSTINASNLVKMYQNDTQFYATFLNNNGSALANTTVRFNINGMFYKRTTDANGIARLAINLRPGNYTLTAINPINGEEKGFNVSVKSLIEASDLNKYYKNDSKFEAKVYNKDGSLAINKTVEFNVNGVFYKRDTNENGMVSLAINLRPGEYDITTIYDGLSMGNKVNVISTLETKDLSMNYQDGSKFSVKALDGQGKPLANQLVRFNVNGVFYNKTTGDDGVANLNINLMRGEYIITSIWNGYEVANEIKIS